MVLGPSCRLREVGRVHSAHPDTKAIPGVYHGNSNGEVCQLFFRKLTPRRIVNVIRSAGSCDFGQ
jgi:hypothetical protein